MLKINFIHKKKKYKEIIVLDWGDKAYMDCLPITIEIYPAKKIKVEVLYDSNRL